jgi:hypothetical protein
MRCLLLPLFILFSFVAGAQYKSYRISDNKDTLNAIDMKGLKQGKWIIRMGPLRGEPGYEEEGVFVNDKKEGKWLRFNLMGDPIAIEFYKWGNKHGLCRYFTPAGPERDESWRAMDPGELYDTITVNDPKDPNKYYREVVKNEGHSFRNGIWRYYYPPTGKLLSTEYYLMDRLFDPFAPDPLSGLPTISLDSMRAKMDTTKAKTQQKIKPKAVLEFEKKTSGKKKAVRDGRTGGG